MGLSPEQEKAIKILRANPNISNAELGQKLFLSPNTVGGFLRRLYRVLGIEGSTNKKKRAELLRVIGGE